MFPEIIPPDGIPDPLKGMEVVIPEGLFLVHEKVVPGISAVSEIFNIDWPLQIDCTAGIAVPSGSGLTFTVDVISAWSGHMGFPPVIVTVYEPEITGVRLRMALYSGGAVDHV